MKTLLGRIMATLSASALMLVGVAGSAVAVSFDQTEIDQTTVTAIAQPRQDGSYQLLIIEQIPHKRQCWSESGSSPVKIEPLLLGFDFTNDCKRATDSNGFSLRMAGTDLALKYSLSLQNINGEVFLMASSGDRNAQPLVIGRTKGMSDGFLKIILEPGWRFTKRSYQGRTLGHFYFTSDQVAPDTAGVGIIPTTSRF